MIQRRTLRCSAGPVFAALLVACSSTSGGGSPGSAGGADGRGGGSGGVGSAEGVTLTVNGGRQISTVPGETGTSIAVDLELDDGSSATLPLEMTLFTVTTADGLAFRGDPATTTLADGCNPTASLTPGHSVSCAVVFTLPAGEVAQSVGYELIDGTSVSAPVSVQTCTTCSGVCVDLSSDPDNCGACDVVVAPAACIGGQAGCTGGQTPCPSGCTDLQTDPANCGGCGNVVAPGQTCEAGNATCGNLTLCDGQCVDTTTDPGNCGACGNACVRTEAGDAYCESGVCAVGVQGSTRESCDALCGSKQCFDAQASYYASYCAGGDFPLGSCSAVPPETETAQGCTSTFLELWCLCAE